ncbi:MAG TPA: 8-oxo-dGTP diphosphatase [Thermoanaerobaculia bacterium]|nr:8-oxo-dGTP diphosphatase [Thermoanaerobaculia bacterium]
MDHIDWSRWRAVDPATLVFVVRDQQVLLIRKKRGLGAGKINGPGGRLEPGESIAECAVRETREELLITPTGLEHAGENLFQFVDGYSIHVHVFRADGFTGTPSETAEAIPIWSTVGALPYDEMWEDDRLWLPHLLARRRFVGRYVFDGDAMVDHQLELG